MLNETEIVSRVDRITVARLRVWISEGWIRPADEPGSKLSPAFSEGDLARAALIRDLVDELGFQEDEVPVVLSLIDQIHGLRSELRSLVEAIDTLPEEMKASVKSTLAVRRLR